MDPYNIAICFGPTLLPIPDGKDQVSYQNSVNEVVKSLIIHYELVFNPRIAGPRYERYSDIMLTPIDPPEIQDIFGDSVDDNFGSTPNESNTGCGMDTVSSANIFNYSDGSTHQLGSPTNSSMVCSINGQQLMGQRLFPQPSITKHQQNNPYVDRPDPDNNNGVPPSSTTFLQNQQSMTGKLSEEHQYAFPSGYFTADSDPHKDRQQEHQLHSAVYHTSPDKRFRKLDLNDNLSSSVIEGHKWRDQLPPSYNSPFCSPVMTERNFILTSPRVTSPRRNKGPAPDPPCSDLYSVINRFVTIQNISTNNNYLF